jgi:hypothetical protein
MSDRFVYDPQWLWLVVQNNERGPLVHTFDEETAAALFLAGDDNTHKTGPVQIARPLLQQAAPMLYGAARHAATTMRLRDNQGGVTQYGYRQAIDFLLSAMAVAEMDIKLRVACQESRKLILYGEAPDEVTEAVYRALRPCLHVNPFRV